MGKSTGGSFVPGADYAVTGGWTYSGQVIEPNETGSVTGSLAGYGTSTVITSTSGVLAYRLPAPAAGVRKQIVCLTASTSAGTATVTCSTGTYDGTNTIATFSSAGFLNLVGVTPTRWGIVGISTGSVAFS